MAGEKPKIIVASLIGRPFAGKDTQAALFQSRYTKVGIAATGMLFRDPDFLARAGFTPLEVGEINRQMKAGILVPDEIPERLMHQAILENAREGNTIVFLTGHPRTVHQEQDLKNWIKMQNESGEIEATSVNVHLFLRRKNANARREERYLAQGREDDKSEQTAHQRHNVFQKNAWPVLRGMWLRRLVGREKIALVFAGQKEEKVYRRLEKVLAPYLPPKKVPQV